MGDNNDREGGEKEAAAARPATTARPASRDANKDRPGSSDSNHKTAAEDAELLRLGRAEQLRVDRQKEKALTYQKLSILREQRNAIQETHMNYLMQHPEINNLIAGLTNAVLMDKPPSIYPFAAQHFANLAGEGGALPPMLVRGPPPLIIVGCDRRSLDLVLEHFPGLFRTPLRTSTRPPMRGERPGVTVDFTTVDRFEKDAASQKLFEWGEDDGGLTGTPLQAVAHVRAMSQVPFLDLSMERGLMAMSCPFVQPRAYSILIMTRQMEQNEAAERLNDTQVAAEDVTVETGSPNNEENTVITASVEKKTRLVDRFDKVIPSGQPPGKIVERIVDFIRAFYADKHRQAH